MKKFFALMLCVVVLATMALPFVSHAAETSYYDVTFKSNIDYNGLKTFGSDLGDGFITIPLSFTCDGVQYEAIRFNSSNFMYYKGTGTTQVGKVSSGMWAWSNDKYKNIVITEPITDASLLSWLDENSTYEAPKCDGTSCIWADDNYDGFCDTCGFALMSFNYDLYDYTLRVLESGLAYYEVDYWVITEERVTPTNEIYYDIYLSATPFKYNNILTSDSEYYVNTVTVNSSDVPVSRGWITSEAGTHTIVGTPKASSHNIDDFFPPNPSLTLQQTVREELRAMTQQVVGTMKILVVCGIACLALLVVLNLFGKRSLLSLKK